MRRERGTLRMSRSLVPVLCEHEYGHPEAKKVHRRREYGSSASEKRCPQACRRVDVFWFESTC